MKDKKLDYKEGWPVPQKSLPMLKGPIILELFDFLEGKRAEIDRLVGIENERDELETARSSLLSDNNILENVLLSTSDAHTKKFIQIARSVLDGSLEIENIYFGVQWGIHESPHLQEAYLLLGNGLAKQGSTQAGDLYKALIDSEHVRGEVKLAAEAHFIGFLYHNTEMEDLSSMRISIEHLMSEDPAFFKGRYDSELLGYAIEKSEGKADQGLVKLAQASYCLGFHDQSDAKKADDFKLEKELLKESLEEDEDLVDLALQIGEAYLTEYPGKKGKIQAEMVYQTITNVHSNPPAKAWNKLGDAILQGPTGEERREDAETYHAIIS